MNLSDLVGAKLKEAWIDQGELYLVTDRGQFYAHAAPGKDPVQGVHNAKAFAGLIVEVKSNPTDHVVKTELGTCTIKAGALEVFGHTGGAPSSAVKVEDF